MRQPASLLDWRALEAQLGPECLRIASYNLHGCVGRDGARDAERIARVIAELGCDTVGLQEVYGLDTLQATLGMTAVAGPHHLWHDRHVGNALLTRRKVLAVRNHDHSWPRHEPRTALDVDLDVDGETVRVIVTHLGLRPAERRFQVRKLLELLKHVPLHERVIVLGDINEWLPLGRPLRWLHELFGQSPAERTFPSRWPVFALDRVWVRPRHALLAFGAHRSALAVQASDHLPIKAIVGTHELPRPALIRLPSAPADARGEAAPEIQVECYAGYRGEQEPRAFTMGGRRCAVIEILDRWITPDHRYFKVQADDGRTWVLRHDAASDDWELASLVGAERRRERSPRA